MDINKYSPRYAIENKHMIKIADYSTEEIFEVLYATKAMKDKFIAHEKTDILQDVSVALLFADISMRTRTALEIGIKQLGAEVVNLGYRDEDMRAGENFTDIVNVIARYGVGAVVTRGISMKDLDEYTAISPLPIINSTNKESLPMQAISDLYTIWSKKKKLEGLKLAYVGKGTNAAASLILAATKCGMKVTVATPEEYAVTNGCVINALQGGNLTMTDNPVLAAKDADIIYTDSYHYHSVTDEHEATVLAPYKVTPSLMALAKPDALFMHPLPASRGVEVAPEVIDGKNSIVYEQAENKLHAIKAILALLIK